MKWREEAVLHTGQEVQVFLDRFAAELGSLSSGLQRAELDAAVASLAACGATQKVAKTASESLTIAKNERRKDLLDDHMRPIVAIAGKITKTHESPTPEIQAMRMPKRRTSDLILAAVARGMADGAAPYEKVYVAQRMPAVFAAEARNSADALQEAIDVRSASVLRRAAATREAAQQASLIRLQIKVLNGLVASRCRQTNRTALEAAWREVRRYPKKPGVKRRKTSRKGNPPDSG